MILKGADSAPPMWENVLSKYQVVSRQAIIRLSANMSIRYEFIIINLALIVTNKCFNRPPCLMMVPPPYQFTQGNQLWVQ